MELLEFYKKCGLLLDIPTLKSASKSYEPIHSKILGNELFKQLEIAQTHSLCFGITITINNNKKFKNRSFNNMTELRKFESVKENMIRSRAYKKLNMILFNEYGNEGKLHFHGLIWGVYETIIVSFANSMRRTTGYVKLELHLTSKIQWCKYIMKDYHISNFPVIYTYQ